MRTMYLDGLRTDDSGLSWIPWKDNEEKIMAKADTELLKKRMARVLAEYFDWPEARRRDAGWGISERFDREGWIWSDRMLCWRKPGVDSEKSIQKIVQP